MRISDLIKMGLSNLSRRKARTALTVVGVIIGTISIVVMISIGIGMNTSFTKQMMEKGSLTLITVSKQQDIFDEKHQYVNSVEQKLDDNLLQSIQGIEHVKSVTPVYQSYIEIFCKGYQTSSQLLAMDLTSLENFSFPKLTYGEYPTEEGSDAIIFGSDVLNYMYNATNWNAPPVNADPSKDKLFITINDYNFEMDWEKEAKKIMVKNPVVMEQTRSDDGYDWSVYMDIDKYKRYYTEFVKARVKKVDQNKALKSLNEYNRIMVSVDNVKNVKKVQDTITELGYRSSSLNSMVESTQQTSNMLQMVLGGVGAVAMLVSAISIANTMIMSIYERTKEIGVMKVLGCLVTDIRKLFLFEAGMIGLFGGIVGIALSYGASFAINKFGGKLFSTILNTGADMMNGAAEGAATNFSIIPIWLPFMAALFAMGVGLLSGYYPARRATKISAIEAMKSEG